MNFNLIVNEIQRLNPKAKIKIYKSNPKMIASSLPVDKLNLPNGYYLDNQKNIIDRKYLENGAYTKIKVVDLTKAIEEQNNIEPETTISGPWGSKKEEIENKIKKLQEDLLEAYEEANNRKKKYPKSAPEINEDPVVLGIKEEQKELELEKEKTLEIINYINHLTKSDTKISQEISELHQKIEDINAVINSREKEIEEIIAGRNSLFGEINNDLQSEIENDRLIKDMKNELQTIQKDLKAIEEKQNQLIAKNNKKVSLVNKWGDLLQTKSSASGYNLNEYLDLLISRGESYYGNEFVEDAINENKASAVSNLFDEMINSANLVNVLNQIANKKLEEQNINKNENPEEITQDVNNTQETQHPKEEQNETKEIIPVTAKLGKRKKANQNLISKFKEKWQNLSTKKKILIGALGVIIVGGVVTSSVFALLNGDTTQIDQTHNIISQISQSTQNDISTQNTLNYNQIQEGSTIYSNAHDAINKVHGLQANEWMGNTPLDVYDYSNNEFMNLTSEQLNDPDFMANLDSKDKAILMGGSDADGFVPLDEVISKGVSK